MFSKKSIVFSDEEGALSLLSLPIILSASDFPGIHIAARNLSTDFARVTNSPASPIHILSSTSSPTTIKAQTCIVIGSITRNPLLKQLEREGKLDTSEIGG